MLDSFLTRVFTSHWLVLLIYAVALMAATEIGFRFGLRLHVAKDEGRKSPIGGIQAAILGLLALLLGFTFALAVSRYETRRTLIVAEANAIGTTYLRASLLPESHRTPVKKLLRDYLAARLEYFDAGADQSRVEAALQTAAKIQQELWRHAEEAAAESPTSIVATFINALNELIDLDTTRQNALRTHVPGAVWLILLAVATCGCYVSGYSAGSSGARSAFSSYMLPLLIAMVIALIVDLDHPRGGLISIKQQALIDLQHSMNDQMP